MFDWVKQRLETGSLGRLTQEAGFPKFPKCLQVWTIFDSGIRECLLNFPETVTQGL